MALVTGANRGIGLALVDQLAARDDIAIVFAATRNPEASSLADLREKYNGKIYPIEMEVVDQTSVAVETQSHLCWLEQTAVKKVETILSGKGLDILINNAGINQKFFGPISET